MRVGGKVAVVAVVVLAIVAITGGLWWWLGRGSSDQHFAVPGSSAAASAQTACVVIEQVPDNGFDLKGAQGTTQVQRLAVISSLGMLAGDQDASFISLRDAVMKPQNVIDATYAAGGTQFESAMKGAHKACADHGIHVTTSAKAPGATASTSAKAACELLEQVPALTKEPPRAQQLIYGDKLSSASGLGLLAADLDPSWTSFSNVVRTPFDMEVRTYSVSHPLVQQARVAALKACQSKGL